MAELSPRPAAQAPLLFLGWAAFCAFLVAGVPPPVDLAGHGAQMQTLLSLLRGDARVGEFYRAQFSVGYGVELWAFLPLAWLFDGAVAAKVALFCALQLQVLAAWLLLRRLGQPAWLLLLAMPLCFNMSYWYGLLPALFSQALLLLNAWAFLRARERPGPWPLVALNALAGLTLLTHFLAFALTPVVLLALALAARPARAGLRTLALGMALPAVFAVPTAWMLLTRAVTPGDWPATEWAWMSHLNWFFKHYGPEGRLAAAGPLLVAAGLLGAAAWKRPLVRKDFLWAFLALAAVYAVTPKTLSGIFLAAQRIPASAGMVLLFAVPAAALPRWLRLGLAALSLLSLGETAAFHWRFAREVDGLQAMVSRAKDPGVHGYYTLQGYRVLGSTPVYLEHLGEWWTAAQGGVGHNFFAQYDHHPVRQVPGRELPLRLEEADVDARARFEQVLVFGEGPLPPPFDGWRQVDAEGKWRRLVR